MKRGSFASTGTVPDDECPREVRCDPGAPEVDDVDHEVLALVDLNDDDEDAPSEQERLQLYDANYDAYVSAWEDERDAA